MRKLLSLTICTLAIWLIIPLSQAGSVNVFIQDISFAPEVINIQVGDTVIWTNRENVLHTVTSTDGGPMESGNLGRFDSYEVTFERAGTYTYTCNFHPSMGGTVVVGGGAPPPTPSTPLVSTTTTPAPATGLPQFDIAPKPKGPQRIKKPRVPRSLGIVTQTTDSNQAQPSELPGSGPAENLLFMIGVAMILTYGASKMGAKKK